MDTQLLQRVFKYIDVHSYRLFPGSYLQVPIRELYTSHDEAIEEYIVEELNARSYPKYFAKRYVRSYVNTNISYEDFDILRTPKYEPEYCIAVATSEKDLPKDAVLPTTNITRTLPGNLPGKPLQQPISGISW